MAGRPRTYVRNEVLDRAMELFWAKGFEGTHLHQLVEVTGLNRFSLYKEFGGKEGLFREALARYLSDSEKIYNQFLAAEPLGFQNIFHYFDQIRYPKDYHGCFMINTLTEKHVVSPKLFGMARSMALKVESLFLRNLKAAQAAGDLSAGEDPKSLAKLLTALDQGIATYGIVSPSNRSKSQITKHVRTLLG